jgi:hypothetical protein
VIVTDSVMEAPGARKQPDQAADAPLQHPAARRQELSLPALTTSEAFPRCWLRGRSKQTRLLRRSVSAGQARSADDDAWPTVVRHPVLQ